MAERSAVLSVDRVVFFSDVAYLRNAEWSLTERRFRQKIQLVEREDGVLTGGSFSVVSGSYLSSLKILPMEVIM